MRIFYLEKRVLLFTILCMSHVFAFGQISIKGKVTSSEDGTGLPGVNLLLKGTTRGTVTDVNGDYNFVVPEQNAVLQFSSIGFTAQEVAVNNRTEINIEMISDAQLLGEVVVVGYGTQKKSDLTGSISSVSGDEIKNQPVTNINSALVGRVAGVYGATNSGQPGSGAMIRIRGFGTVNNNSPLYVVDGQFLYNIHNIHPNDIERIEVLKDASATAIYGSRGANGVIVITTRKGVSGDPVVTFDAFTGASSSTFVPDIANSQQLHDFLKESYENDGLPFPQGITDLYERGVDTDWWDVTTQSGLTQNYNVSIRGGSDKFKSAISLGYVKEEGFIKTTSYERFTPNWNAEYKLSSKVTVGANLNLVSSKGRSMSNFSEPVWQIISADPFSYVYNPLVDESDPNYRFNKYAPTEWAYTDNPLFLLESNNAFTKTFNTYGYVFTNIEIIEGLDYKVQFNFNRSTTSYSSFSPEFNAIPSELNMGRLKRRDVNSMNVSESSGLNKMWQQTLHYKKTFANKHDLSAVVGITYEDNYYESVGGTRSNFPSNEPEYWVISAGTAGPNIWGSKSENAILSYLGRVNYGYGDRYLATVSYRADGSSRFTEGNRWGYFPSFSVGWRLSNEQFFKDLDIPQISELKFRAGWGQTGNQSISNSAVITTINTAPWFVYTFGDKNYPAYGPRNMGNPNLLWETSKQTNVGIDAGFLNHQLTFTLDYFKKTTENMLLRVPLPNYLGYPNSPFTNAGSVENKGFEFSVNWQQQLGDFYYSIGANGSTYKNTVTKLGDLNDPIFSGGFKSGLTKTEVGGPMAMFFGYQWDGIFQNEEEILAHSDENGELLQPLAKPGDFRFVDVNGDGLLNDEDRTYIGNPHPDLIYGVNFNLGYKNFDISGLLSGTVGNDMWNENLAKYFVSIDNVQAIAYTDAWRKEGDNTKIARISQSNLNNNNRTSSWYVEDGSYMRLKNLQIGYTLPEKLLSKTNILSEARIYFSGQNLFTITDYTGMDPEVGSSNPLTLGFEITRYPSSRILTLGLNAKF
jgi:TonB-linked SusC/RagA family outer membrane protein